jgi:amino acid transporter
LLVVLLPVGIAVVALAGRMVMFGVIALIGAGQVVLTAVLDVVAVRHAPGATAFQATGGGHTVHATASLATLFICGSLPLFLGGELKRPARTIRRGLTGTYLLTAAVISLAVVPLATAPGLLRTDIPGVTVARLFSGNGLAEAIGIGVAVSIAGVIVCEYLALTRLVHAIGRWRMRPIAIGIGAVMVLSAPLSLINPDGFYSALIKPSLAALWVSQLFVFVAYPRFAAKQRQRALPAWTLSAAASGFAIYGLWTALQTATS